MIKNIAISMLISAAVYASSFNIELKKDSWNLVGTPIDLNISSLNLGVDDIVWHYKDDEWSSNMTTNSYGKIESFNANDAFWVYSTVDNNISLNNDENITMIKPFKKYWSMYSPLENTILNNDFNSEDVGIVWSYNDNNWSVWDPSNLYQDSNYLIAQNIEVGQGSWVFSKDNFVSKITKLSTSDVEGIWNLSFEIDTTIDYSSLDIGVNFVKHEYDGVDGAFDPDIGKFIYDDISIVSSILSTPNAVFIQGIGDSGSKTDVYNKDWDPDNILDNSIELNGNILTLKLGYIMKNQTAVSEATFKAITNYDIVITSNNENLIKNNKTISDSFQIETLSKTISFTNTKGIMVEMQIK